MQNNPIVIVGGGPVGCVLALLLAKQGIQTTVLEARAKGASHQDSRALALSFGSRNLFQKMGLWQALQPHATPINTIHVSQKGSIGRTLLHAHEHQQEALGYVLSYGALSAVLDATLTAQSLVTVVNEATAQKISHQTAQATVTYLQQNALYSAASPLVVLADGGRSLDELAGLTRDVKEYGHSALVSKISATLPHDNIAYERFLPSGPIALLPNGLRDFSLVWTGKSADIEALLALDDAAFLNAFQAAFGERVGQFKSIEKRMAFPLKMAQLNHASQADFSHIAVIGNAAQTMHPVAGQGFNVGLRDAESLALHIAACQIDTLAEPQYRLGSEAMLKAYQQSRTKDTQGGLKFTDFLVGTFSNEILGVGAMRGAGLGLLQVLSPVKAYLVRKMSYGK